ncbi:hypothetical protein Tco_0722881 [Tanacetum coccineum]
MSNTNNNLQTQTLNALHNAIMEAGGKDHPPMLALGNHVQWKSRIKRYIDTKPNSELIHYCLANPPHIFTWVEQTNPDSEAEVVQIILTRIDNDIYSTVDAFPNVCEMWKVIERFYKMMNDLVRNKCNVTNRQVYVHFLLQLQPEWQRFVTLVKQSQELKIVSYHKLYDILKQHQNEVNEIRAERLARKSTNLPTITSELDQTLVDQIRIILQEQIDELGIWACSKRMSKTQTGKGCSLSQGEDAIVLEAHYLYMAQIQKVTPDVADNSGPIFDAEPLQKDGNDDPAKEHDLLASLIEKLKCEIDDIKNRVIPTTSFSRPQLKSNQLEDRVMPNNSQRKKQEVEDHRRNFKFSNNKTFVTTCNDSLNAKTSNVNFVCVTCGKCVPNDNHDMCVLHYMNSVNSRIKQPIAMPISTKEPKRTMNQSVATPFKRTVALESTNQKPRSKIKKQYE